MTYGQSMSGTWDKSLVIDSDQNKRSIVEPGVSQIFRH